MRALHPIFWLGGAALLFYFFAPKREELSGGPAIATIPDPAGNYPAVYPFFQGSGAVDPTGAQWPGWQTPPFNPEGWPGGTVQVGSSFIDQSASAFMY